MLIGEYEEYDSSMPVPQAYLSTVRFPMEEVDYTDDLDAMRDDGMITINNEEELKAWAELAFVSYQIWDMKIPEGTIVKEEHPCPKCGP